MGPDDEWDIDLGTVMVITEVPHASVSRLIMAPSRRWLVIIPDDGTVYRFTYWTDAIAFADREMRK